MEFKQFEGPFRDVEMLGLRDLFCGERLILDLIECKRIKPLDPPPPDVSEDEYYILEPTAESRVWRLTYQLPFAVKIGTPGVEPKKPSTVRLTAPCMYTEKSDWIDEFNFSPTLTDFVPTHYIFNLTDHSLEVLADNNPEIERVENTLG